MHRPTRLARHVYMKYAFNEETCSSRSLASVAPAERSFVCNSMIKIYCRFACTARGPLARDVYLRAIKSLSQVADRGAAGGSYRQTLQRINGR